MLALEKHIGTAFNYLRYMEECLNGQPGAEVNEKVRLVDFTADMDRMYEVLKSIGKESVAKENDGILGVFARRHGITEGEYKQMFSDRQFEEEDANIGLVIRYAGINTAASRVQDVVLRGKKRDKVRKLQECVDTYGEYVNRCKEFLGYDLCLNDTVKIINSAIDTMDDDREIMSSVKDFIKITEKREKLRKQFRNWLYSDKGTIAVFGMVDNLMGHIKQRNDFVKVSVPKASFEMSPTCDKIDYERLLNETNFDNTK